MTFPKKLTLAFVLLGALLILLFLINQITAPTPPDYQKNTAKMLVDARSPSLIYETKINDIGAKNNLSYEICWNLDKTLKIKSNEWIKEHYIEWENYIGDNYSLDEVTIAIEKLLGLNFAFSFRTNYLRRNSTLSSENKHLKKLVDHIFPRLNEVGINIDRAIPNKKLLPYKNLDEESKSIILNDIDFTVDDLSYFILDSSISNKDIISMLDHVQNVEDIVSYKKIAAVSILDYAVYAGRRPVVEKLIKLGMEPTHDTYLNSTMDWALVKLSRGISENVNDIKNIIEIIILLDMWGAKSKFKVKKENDIQGPSSKHSFFFDKHTIDHLLYEYNLDLMAIEEYGGLSENIAKYFIDEIKNRRDESVAKGMGFANIKDVESACDKFVSDLHESWGPEDINSTINSVKRLYPKENKILTKELNLIDPILIDYLRPNKNLSKSVSKIEKDLDIDIYKSIKLGNVQYIINKIETSNISNEESSVLFYHILAFDTALYNYLKNSKFNQKIIDLRKLHALGVTDKYSIQKLEKAGFALSYRDLNNNNLIHFAAMNFDLLLLKYLLERDVPYLTGTHTQGQDPLHILLSRVPFVVDSEKINKTLEVMFQFKPNIDKHHLSRMSLIKHLNHERYLMIIKQHPALTVKKDTKLPRVDILDVEV
jgi:hypothetical protein